MTFKPAVECYSGSRYAERPVAVHVAGWRLEVEQVLRRWQTPAGPGFDVRVSGGRRFLLEYDEACDSWTLVELADA